MAEAALFPNFFCRFVVLSFTIETTSYDFQQVNKVFKLFTKGKKISPHFFFLPFFCHVFSSLPSMTYLCILPLSISFTLFSIFMFAQSRTEGQTIYPCERLFAHTDGVLCYAKIKVDGTAWPVLSPHPVNARVKGDHQRERERERERERKRRMDSCFHWGKWKGKFFCFVEL